MLALLMGVGCFAATCAVRAQFVYTVDSGVVTITGPNSISGDVTIPANINGQPVVSIGDSAFSGSSMTHVTFPNSITNIGPAAFQYCYGLTNLDLPHGLLQIGDLAFNGCASLTSVSIPNSTPAAQIAIP